MLAMTTVADPNELSSFAPLTSTEEQIELVEHYSAHNYHPLPLVVAEADGAWVTDVEGKRYLDMLAAYSALNFGHRHPDLIAAAHAQLDQGDPDQPGVPQRQDGALLPGSGRALRDGDGPAHELRGGGRRDRGEDRTTVGIRREGRAGGPRQDRHLHGQLPRPHDHDRELLDRPKRQGRIRAVHARVRDRCLRRRRSARDRARRPRGRRLPRRAHPGRGGRHRASRGVPAARPRALRRASGAADRRRGAVGPRSHRTHVRVRARRRAPGRLRAGQGARRRHRADLGRRVEPRRARGLPPG